MALVNGSSPGRPWPSGFFSTSAMERLLHLRDLIWRCQESVYYSAYSVRKFLSLAQRGVAGLVGIEGGVVSGCFNPPDSGVRAPDRRPRHAKHYHEA